MAGKIQLFYRRGAGGTINGRTIGAIGGSFIIDGVSIERVTGATTAAGGGFIIDGVSDEVGTDERVGAWSDIGTSDNNGGFFIDGGGGYG